jgi:hypothetical protein
VIQAQTGRNRKGDVFFPTVARRNRKRKGRLRMDRVLTLRPHFDHGGLKRSDEICGGQTDDTQP